MDGTHEEEEEHINLPSEKEMEIYHATAESDRGDMDPTMADTPAAATIQSDVVNENNQHSSGAVQCQTDNMTKVGELGGRPIRGKLGSRTHVRIEGGLKIILNQVCTLKCPGPDQNVHIYQPGLERLLTLWPKIMNAIENNHPFSAVLEVETDILTDALIEFVVIMVDNGNKRVNFFHVQFDMTQAITVSIASPTANTFQSGTKIQMVALTRGGLEKLSSFLFRHIDQRIQETVMKSLTNQKRELEEEAKNYCD